MASAAQAHPCGQPLWRGSQSTVATRSCASASQLLLQMRCVGLPGVPALLIAGLHPCLGATPLWRQQGWAARLRLQVEAAAAIAAAVLARVRTAPGGSAFHQSYFGDVPKLTAVTPLNGGVLWIQYRPTSTQGGPVPVKCQLSQKPP
mmetsp:Transcript_133864/g.260671  ORF Transcript_133864/g.260671 Transcript_133864/m.260671 type:complete len:147 (+) Transcript_133864:488-928(+)